MIEFSRHAKRRMKLYNITEKDVTSVIDQGKRESLSSGRVSITHELAGKFQYPIKVIGVQDAKSFLVVTAYPIKGGKGSK
jgi:hypothetical protein